ncbi:helix-turn-helix domain-containing protein [Streptomyces aureus]|uniref:helix-turn-helix domain-containing protein n=1 Tax=Streptomyces aureus TaxID=193461 RepID=UPI0033D3A9F7
MTSSQGDGGSMPSGRQALAAELRRLKERSGLSFGRLADRTHYSRSSWERFLNGKQLPTAVALEEFATVMDADADFLRGLLVAALEPEDAPGARGEVGLLSGTGVETGPAIPGGAVGGTGTGPRTGPGIAAGTGLPVGAGIAAGAGLLIGPGIAAAPGAAIPSGAAGGTGTGLLAGAGIGIGSETGAGAGLPAGAQGGTGAGTGGLTTGTAEGSAGSGVTAAGTGEPGEPVVAPAAEPPVSAGTGATQPSASPPGTVPPVAPRPGPARDWRNALRMTGLVTAGALVGSLATVLALGAGAGPSHGASGDDSASGTASGTAAPSPRPGCSHDTCLRRDPQAMDCQWDATTARETWLRGMHIELRYSAACGAVWGRIESGAIGDSVTIKDKYDLELSATVRVDRDTYTGMLAVAADAPPRTVTVCGTIPKYHARECSPEDLVQP